MFDASMPPMSRYENYKDGKSISGEGDVRVNECFMFAAGMVFEIDGAEEMHSKIARLHDHKGTLVVACREPLRKAVQDALRTAWSVVGFEPGENVEFYAVDDPAWANYWSGRRFESNWTPHSYHFGEDGDVAYEAAWEPEAMRKKLAEWLETHMPGEGALWNNRGREYVCFKDTETLARFRTWWSLSQ